MFKGMIIIWLPLHLFLQSRKVNAFTAANPQAEIIRLGILRCDTVDRTGRD